MCGRCVHLPRLNFIALKNLSQGGSQEKSFKFSLKTLTAGASKSRFLKSYHTVDMSAAKSLHNNCHLPQLKIIITHIGKGAGYKTKCSETKSEFLDGYID